ncbi:GNAT family N-acetyltransferase [Haloparvum alkalitolerans]|uniref:GNAT family N-acetyltransferase n=1 Tax=Haloparvum alkalitolerans TaxID=1042953 RepID=UPI003CEEEF7E
MTTTPTSTADRSADPTAERSPAPAPSPRGPRFVDKFGVRWRIRAADGDDRDALTAMYGDFGTADRAQGLPPVTESRTERWLDDLFERGWNVVAEGEAGVVGHATLTPTDADEPELAVFVHPTYQDRGLGTELCRHIVARAAATDRAAVVLTVERRNRAALSVYRGLGFETVEGERGDLWMRLPLTDGS